MRKPRISAPVARIAAVAIAFLLGIYGFAAAYRALPGHASTIGGNAFKSLQLVVGHFPGELDDRPLPWSLEIARWALPLLTFWTTIALAWLQVRNPVRLRWIARRGEHLVLYGDNPLAARIAAGDTAGDRAARRATIVWTDDPAAPWVARAADAGMPNAPTSGAADGTAALGLNRARAVLLVADEDVRNMTLASAAIAAAARGRPPGDPLPVVARIDDLDLRASVEARLEQGGEKAARLRVVSLPDIVARRLFLDQPLDRFVRPDQPSRGVFVIGLTPTTERYVLRLLAAGHFRDGRRPALLILDPAAEQREAVFRARRPGAGALAPVTFETASDEPALIGQVLSRAIARHGAPIAIVIDPADASRALALAQAVEAHFEAAGIVPPPIHARLGDCPEDQLGGSIHPFGGSATVADPELLLQERHDILARAIHEFYFDGRLSEGDVAGSRISMREWDDLPEAVRDDNRLVADCYQLKLRDIGARVVAGGDGALRLESSEVEDLARAEHDRWAAAKLIDGWVFGATRDDAGRRHPDLIPYDSLSERIRELDREQIRLITRLLPGAGLAPRRTLPLIVTAGNGSQGAPLGDGLGWLAAQYPDRVPVFVGAIEPPGVRAALAGAARAGAIVQLTVAAGRAAAGQPLTSLPADARRLLRAADMIRALAPGDTGAVELAGGEALQVRVAADGGVVAAPWLR